jgi:hypothetical protein
MIMRSFIICVGKMRNTCRILPGRPEGGKTLGWENNIKVDLIAQSV